MPWGSAFGPGLRLAGFSLIAALLVAGCYHPTLGEGEFLCGPGGACPMGLKCLPDNRCYRDPSRFDGGVGDALPADGGGGGGTDSAPPQIDTGMCPRGVTCSPGALPSQICDPVCQTGCSCSQRCDVLGAPPACAPLPVNPVELFEICGAAGRQCKPGAVCAEESNPACGDRCYRACRQDSDCDQARCIESLFDSQNTFQTKVCSTRIDGCNPTGLTPECNSSGPGNHPFPLFGCYLLEPGKDDATSCHCAGSIEVGLPCQAPHECRPGLECLPDATNDRRCRRLCTLDNAGLGRVLCPAGQTCRPVGRSVRFGACI